MNQCQAHFGLFTTVTEAGFELSRASAFTSKPGPADSSSREALFSRKSGGTCTLIATFTAPSAVVWIVAAEKVGWLSRAFFLPKCRASVDASPLA